VNKPNPVQDYEEVRGTPNYPATPGELERWGDLERLLSHAEIEAMSSTEIVRRAKARMVAREARGLNADGTPKHGGVPIGSEAPPAPESGQHYNDYRDVLVDWYRKEPTQARFNAKELAFEKYRREYQARERAK